MDSTRLLANDLSIAYAVTWWASLLLLNTVGWGLLRSATARWHDSGWAMARPLFALSAAYVVWVVAHGIPVFTSCGIWLLVLLGGLAAIGLARSGSRPTFNPAVLRQISLAELRFVLPFVFYLAMRGLNHDIFGLEKYMDFAFMNSAMQTRVMPVPDPWFSGYPINYYHFGHFLAAFLCKLSGVPSPYGYNLMLATIFAGVFQLAYAFVAEMTIAVPRTISTSFALIAGAWLTLGGNVHGFLYGFVKPWLVGSHLIAPPRQAFLISDPTRFVGHDPLTNDKLIHEFPAYALYVGDLHAHLSNLPAVLLFLNVLLAWMRAEKAPESGIPGRFGWLAIAAWLIGVFAITNTWDALMYTGLLGTWLAVDAAFAIRSGGTQLFRKTRNGLVAAIITALTIAPFWLNFEPHSEGFFLTHSHTPLWQWLILYGLQAVLAILACIVAGKAKGSRLGDAELKVLLTLTVFGVVFALVPEVVYLKDIYGSEFYRGNTAFKFGFQAFTLLTLAASIGLALMLSMPRPRLSRLATVVLIELALTPPFYYAWFVLQGGFGVWHERTWTLDGQRTLAQRSPEDRAVIDWLQSHAQSEQVLVEAVGDSYTYGARISSNTGFTSVIGWPTHELLWRGEAADVWKRRDDVAALYNARTPVDAEAVIARYHIRWLILGGFERERYPTLDAALLQSLGTIAFRSGETVIVDLETQPIRNQEHPN